MADAHLETTSLVGRQDAEDAEREGGLPKRSLQVLGRRRDERENEGVLRDMNNVIKRHQKDNYSKENQQPSGENQQLSGENQQPSGSSKRPQEEKPKNQRPPLNVFYSRRPQKKDPLEFKVLKENPGLDINTLLDVLYSIRYRKELNSTISLRLRIDHVDDKSCEVDDKLRELRKAVSSLVDGKRRITEHESRYGSSWRHSICYPLDPVAIDSFPHLKESWNGTLSKVRLPVLFGMTQSKRVSSNSSEASSLSLGQTLVARGRGERIILDRDTFKDKHVLVCCVCAPVLYDESRGFQCLLNLCNELCLMRKDVAIVMVARMNVLVNTKEDFDHVFSAFPTSCFAVPYEDWDRRERIWKLLNCSVFEFQCVVYGTNGLLLKSFCVDDYTYPYGAEAFPFTEEDVEGVLKRRKQLRADRLENLLRPYESSLDDVVVYEVNDGQEKRISEVIKDKHVGLYVCCCGRLIPILHKLYEQCKEKNEEFEIVVFYLPLLSQLDPDLFKEKIDGLLQQQNIRGWWCLPFNNSVSLRFWGLTKGYRSGFPDFATWEDKLIVVGPRGNILDMYGAQIIQRADGFDAYPFTRAAVVEKKIEVVKDLRLESLLEDQQFFRGVDPSDKLFAGTLLSSKKKIIIYMGNSLEYISNGIHYDFDGLVSQYTEMKKEKDEFEVVFIEFVYNHEEIPGVTNDMEFCGMPWYIHCPLDGTHTSLAYKLKELFPVQSLVGFGEDGRICSVKPLQSLHKSDTAGLCLEDSLYDDIHQLFHFNEYGII